MAVNPLIVFVGLSVTTVGGIVAVVQNKAPSAPVPASVSTQHAPLVVPASKEPATTKMASLPNPFPKIVEQKAPPSPLAAEQPVKKPAKSKTTSTPKKPAVDTPSFDMVRVEKDGGAVVVGKAVPGAKIILKLNGKTIGETTANRQGDWVFVPDQLIPQGSNELIVEATGKDKKTVRSKQSIYIAIPKGGKEKPLIVVSTPDAPTRVLQKPEAKTEPVKITAIEQVEPVVIKTAEKKPDAQPVDTARPLVSTVEKKSDKAPVKKLASLAEPATKPLITEIKTRTPDVVKKNIPATTAPLSFGTVDYNDKGDIVFTGKATAGATVRLYVDNAFAGDTVVGKDGNWVFRGKGNIKPGGHKLRADQVTNTGKVAQRATVPFVRAKPKQVASLLKTREQPVVTAPVTKKPEAEKLPVKSVIAEPVVPIDTAKTVPANETDTVSLQKQAKAVDTKTETDTKTKPEKLVSHVVIQPGNNLWNISRVIYGKGVAYTTIYQANQDQIKNPHQIFPGQIFTTPGTTSTGSIEPDQREPLTGLKTAEN